MGFELRLPPAVRRQIEEYIDRFEVEFQMEALATIRGHLEKLAENPRLGRTPNRAFGFPVYVFSMRIGGVRYAVRVAYCYSQDEKAIIITGVEQQLM